MHIAAVYSVISSYASIVAAAAAAGARVSAPPRRGNKLCDSLFHSDGDDNIRFCYYHFFFFFAPTPSVRLYLDLRTFRTRRARAERGVRPRPPVVARSSNERVDAAAAHETGSPGCRRIRRVARRAGSPVPRRGKTPTTPPGAGERTDYRALVRPVAERGEDGKGLTRRESDGVAPHDDLGTTCATVGR